MKLRMISGMARTGSTLLCDILAQDPSLHVTSTTETPDMLKREADTFTSWPAQGRHQQDPEKEALRRTGVLQHVVEGAYSQHNGKDTVDKSRGWSHIGLMVERNFDDPRMVLCVRDLGDVLGSLEYHHRKHPEVNVFPEGVNTLEDRCLFWLRADQFVGAAIVGMRDALFTVPAISLVVRYELWCSLPEVWIPAIREFLDLPPFVHQMDRVEQSATDLDAIYLGVYPHYTTDREPRPVEPPVPGERRRLIPDEILNGLWNENPGFGWYQDKFGWNAGKVVP